MAKFDYSKDDIVESLIQVGLKKSDNIFNHNNLGFFGKLKNAIDEESYCKIFKNAIFEVIGEDGTLVVPTFTYSFCWNRIFDKNKTLGTCGIFSEFIRKDSDAQRSDDANFSMSAIGKNANFFTRDSPSNPFGKDSFWERFLLKKGKICNFNFDSGSSFIHYVERLLNVPYRYDKPFAGKSMINGRLENRTFYHFVRDPDDPTVYPDCTKFDKKARELKKTKTANLGKGQIVCISAHDTMEIIKEEIQNQPDFLIKGSF